MLDGAGGHDCNGAFIARDHGNHLPVVEAIALEHAPAGVGHWLDWVNDEVLLADHRRAAFRSLVASSATTASCTASASASLPQ